MVAPPMRVAAVVLAGVLGSSSAFAQTEDSLPRQSRPALMAAQVHYERSREQYATGRYHAAAMSLERALTLDPAGTTLWFNLGVVYERMGRLDLATTAYNRYLQSATDGEERARTERILVRLRGAREEFAQARQASRGRADTLFWLTLTTSLACLASGVTYLAVGPRDSITPGAVLMGAGGVLGATAVVLYAARKDDPHGSVYLSAAFAPERAGLGLTLTF